MFLLKILFLFLIIFFTLAIIVGYFLSGKGYKGEVSDHFDGKKFMNPSGKPANGFEQVFRYFRERKPDKWVKNYETFVRSEAIPIPKINEIQYIFVNHSTFLIQYQGVNILTDPVWSKRCSATQLAGPERMRPPGLHFKNLPEIHVVLLSHNHYDHLDKNTIQAICKIYNPLFVVPLGLTDIVQKFGAQKIIELDWWQTTTFGNLEIKATPANHFSSRGLFDRDKTLWAGYIIASAKHKIYFVGDTGYSDIFKEIGQREGEIDLALIPIGAYLPKWFMSPIHVSPDQAVQIHQDINSKQSVAMHFGTFPLADDNPERSIGELKTALQAANISQQTFFVPDEGECYTYS